jgi:hypothetical protein
MEQPELKWPMTAIMPGSDTMRLATFTASLGSERSSNSSTRTLKSGKRLALTASSTARSAARRMPWPSTAMSPVRGTARAMRTSFSLGPQPANSANAAKTAIFLRMTFLLVAARLIGRYS